MPSSLRHQLLIDMKDAVIVDVEARRAIRQAEVGAARTMIERSQDRFGLYPERLAPTALRFGEMLGWLVHERGIEPHIRCSTSPSARRTFERADFDYDEAAISIPAGGREPSSTSSLHHPGTA